MYAFAQDVAASGGYWLMCAADKLYACETSIVGSIGVVGSTFGAVEAMRRLGIERRLLTAGARCRRSQPGGGPHIEHGEDTQIDRCSHVDAPCAASASVRSRRQRLRAVRPCKVHSALRGAHVAALLLPPPALALNL